MKWLFSILGLLVLLLIYTNILGIKKEKELRTSNRFLVAETHIKPMLTFLKKGQIINYEGISIIDEYNMYFVSNNILAPKYLLSNKEYTNHTFDTVLSIWRNDDTVLQHFNSHHQILSQSSDGQLTYALSVKHPQK